MYMKFDFFYIMNIKNLNIPLKKGLFEDLNVGLNTTKT